jgi:PPOX class probable F420-dependent enzyme
MVSAMTSWAEMGNAKYAVLTSYKKDRTPVGAPVWLAPDGDRLVVWTSADSWKVKRIRRDPEVTLQISDARGRKTRGDVLTGVAEIQDAAGTEQTRVAIGRKYGLIGVVMVRFSSLVRGKDATVGIAISQPS